MTSAALSPTSVDGGTVRLRPWRAADADDVFAACQDPDVQAWTGVPVPYLRGHASTFLAGSAGEWAKGLPQFAVTDPPDARLLGSVAFPRSYGPGVLEIGYWVAPWARRQGVATAAVRAVCRWAFAALPDLVRIEWLAMVDNDASWQVAARSGFTLEGTLRSRAERLGRRHDLLVASRLRDDPPP